MRYGRTGRAGAPVHHRAKQKHRPWVGLEIRARGLSSHPRAHARAQYGLVPAKYATPEAVSYVISPKSQRTPDVIALFVKGFPK